MIVEKIIVNKLPQNCYTCQFGILEQYEDCHDFKCSILGERVSEGVPLEDCPISDKSLSGARILLNALEEWCRNNDYGYEAVLKNELNRINWGG